MTPNSSVRRASAAAAAADVVSVTIAAALQPRIGRHDNGDACDVPA